MLHELKAASVNCAQSKTYRGISPNLPNVIRTEFRKCKPELFRKIFHGRANSAGDLHPLQDREVPSIEPEPHAYNTDLFLCQKRWNKRMKSWSFRNWGDTFYVLPLAAAPLSPNSVVSLNTAHCNLGFIAPEDIKVAEKSIHEGPLDIPSDEGKEKRDSEIIPMRRRKVWFCSEKYEVCLQQSDPVTGGICNGAVPEVICKKDKAIL